MSFRTSILTTCRLEKVGSIGVNICPDDMSSGKPFYVIYFFNNVKWKDVVLFYLYQRLVIGIGFPVTKLAPCFHFLVACTFFSLSSFGDAGNLKVRFLVLDFFLICNSTSFYSNFGGFMSGCWSPKSQPSSPSAGNNLHHRWRKRFLVILLSSPPILR